MGKRRKADELDFAETEVLDGGSIPPPDGEATVVLGEDYRDEIEAEYAEYTDSANDSA
jgi:hypothetical protein